MGKPFPKFKVAAVQAAPVFLDLERTPDKALALIDEASRNGAGLSAFPEVFIAGYPYWNRLENVFKTTPFFIEMLKNSVAVPGQYNRFDVLSLRLNRAPWRPITEVGTSPRPEDFLSDDEPES